MRNWIHWGGRQAPGHLHIWRPGGKFGTFFGNPELANRVYHGSHTAQPYDLQLCWQRGFVICHTVFKLVRKHLQSLIWIPLGNIWFYIQGNGTTNSNVTKVKTDETMVSYFIVRRGVTKTSNRVTSNGVTGKRVTAKSTEGKFLRKRVTAKNTDRKFSRKRVTK